MTQDRWDRLMSFSERVGLPGVLLLGAMALVGFLGDKYLDRVISVQERLMAVMEDIREHSIAQAKRQTKALERIEKLMERERKP